MLKSGKSAGKHRPFRQSFVVLLILALFLCGAVYIALTNLHEIGQLRDQTLNLAKSALAFLPVDHIKTLDVNESDLDKDTYRTLKDSLVRLKAANPDVVFTYLYTQKNGGIYFMVDSELPDSEGYSPPGQLYEEASPGDREIFQDGNAVVTAPLSDRWGTWVSALVPVSDPATNQVIAVLGMDYDAKKWSAYTLEHVANAVVLIGLMFSLLGVLYRVYKRSREREQLIRKLNDSEAMFRTVFEQAPFGVAIINDYHELSSVNAMFQKILGRTSAELGSLSWVDITHTGDIQEELALFDDFKTGKTEGYTMEKRFLRPDGSSIWVQIVVARLLMSDSRTQTHLCILHDIQERKQAQEALQESERSKSVLLSHLPGMAYRCRNDRDWTMLFVSEGCFALTGYMPDSLLYNRNLSFNDLIRSDYRELLRKEWDRLLAKKAPFRYEYEITTATGERKWVLEMGQGIYNPQGEAEALEGIVIDITESKRQLAQIQHMNDHDFLTGLYSRKYFEEARRSMDAQEYLPLSIIIADINGIRTLNNAFGYEQVDRVIAQVAKVLQRCCREGDILARTGGDEFGILLPRTSQEESYRFVQQMKRACEGADFRSLGDSVHISLSLGCGTKTESRESIDSIEREAEENLHKNKILEQKSYHNAMLTSIMATMNARSQETEEHAQRLVALSRMIGTHLALPQKSLDDLQLFSMLHDIGKIGIDDRILNKPGKLSEEEWVIMKKHPEIGYRIAISLPELSSVAEYILTHHERWDGKGYPKGLMGEEIPLLSRILAVADAYDAMTEERVYRKKRSKEEAMDEIMNNSGMQFDPAIVEIFAHCMR